MDMLLWLVCIPGGNLVLGVIVGAVAMFYAMHKGWIGGGKKKGPKWVCGFCETENDGDVKECGDCGVAKAESLKERRRKALAEARRRVTEAEREADEDSTRTAAEQERINTARAEAAVLEGCPSCGEQNPPDMKFCGSCGTQLNPPPPPPLPRH